MYYSRPLLLLSALLPLSQADLNDCDDDPGYTFGRYKTLDGNIVTRTCAWFKEDPDLLQSRRDEWCNAQWLHNNLKDKCPDTCLKDECLPPVFTTCTNKSPPGDGSFWHDRGGEQYDCLWYSLGDNCRIFGNDFANFGWTANQACCICGGGDKQE